ncbi:hypothetical protein AAG570_012625 [Ranatra chinensis]|uniref:Uncharacterized protein n=1 Tax=Ranatra chinensis TaxID=642074 RepID=A0ABD0YEE6_9HEMI
MFICREFAYDMDYKYTIRGIAGGEEAGNDGRRFGQKVGGLQYCGPGMLLDANCLDCLAHRRQQQSQHHQQQQPQQMLQPVQATRPIRQLRPLPAARNHRLAYGPGTLAA